MWLKGCSDPGTSHSIQDVSSVAGNGGCLPGSTVVLNPALLYDVSNLAIVLPKQGAARNPGAGGERGLRRSSIPTTCGLTD